MLSEMSYTQNAETLDVNENTGVEMNIELL